MNVCSLSLTKKNMKTTMLVKLGLVFPFILLVDYLIMVLLGCSSCLFGVGTSYYCNTYCIVGKVLLILSAVLFGLIIYPELKALIKNKKHVATPEK